MFDKAPLKGEGQFVDYGAGKPPEKPQVETVYVERRVPKQLEGRVHRLISDFLVKNGYNPEEI